MPEFTTREELENIQLDGLKWTVSHVYENSELYRRRFDEAGITPGDIRTLGDIRKLPLLTADDLRDGYPFPLLSAPIADIVRIHASSGTTGRRKVLAYTRRDIDDWKNMFARVYEMAGLTKEDRVQICVGYGLWTAGAGFQLGCEHFGAMAIPIGPGNIEMQLRFLQDLGTTVICCTGSMALLLAEEVGARGMRDDIRLHTVIMGSERTSEAMRNRIKELLGVREIFDIPGMTELYGPGTGLDCRYHTGIHYWADYYIMELLDPETLEPVPDGEVGEMVYTTLRKEAAPLIRYRSKDLTRLVPGGCPCGSPLPRHERIIGRSDDMFVIRGVNVYPSHIDEILSARDGVGSEYQIHLDRKEDGRDHMTVVVERAVEGEPSADGTLAAGIESDIRDSLMVSGKVNIVDHRELPRAEGKSKRVFDHRGV